MEMSTHIELPLISPSLKCPSPPKFSLTDHFEMQFEKAKQLFFNFSVIFPSILA